MRDAGARDRPVSGGDERSKARAIHDYTAGEDTDVFADSIVPEVSLKWALTGDADVYADEAAAYDSLDAGTAQAEIRRFAAELGAAKRRVLVTTIPTPGMAEAMEQERDAYLAQMKAEMSEAELDALIAKTLDFDAWNASECSNADFMIRVDELPPPEETPEYQIYEINGISVYESPSDLEAISYNRLYLDLSGVPEEDRVFTFLYIQCLFQSLKMPGMAEWKRKIRLSAICMIFP